MMQQTDHPVKTEGITISWATRYDLLVQLMTLGQAGRLRARMADRLHARPGDVVLDVGCGTGDLALVLARRVGPTGHIVGIDAAPEMIARARRKAARAKAAIDFRVEAVEALSFPDQAFDRVVSTLVFHHLPGDLKGRALLSIARVLRPGGSLLIVDALRPRGHLPFHSTRLAHGQDLADSLRAAGFGDVETGGFGIMGLDYLAARRSSNSTRQ